MVYFTYNGLFTYMVLAYEWNSYSEMRKGLRVSANPIGVQEGFGMTGNSVLRNFKPTVLQMSSIEIGHFAFWPAEVESPRDRLLYLHFVKSVCDL